MASSTSYSSSRPRSRAATATTTESARAWDKPALLRVWGYVTEGKRPNRAETTHLEADYQVHIQSHDDAEEIDLLRPRWYESRRPVHRPRPAPVQILQRTSSRLDRFSHYADGEVTVRFLDCELEPGRWGPICFCLAKRIHVPNDQSHYYWNVPVSVLTGAFARYLDGLRSLGSSGAPASVLTSVAEVQPDDTAFTRPYELETGRRRRRARRHGKDGGSSGTKVDIFYQSITSPTLAVPVINTAQLRNLSRTPGHPPLLGRNRRRQKRLKFDGPRRVAPPAPVTDEKGRTGPSVSEDGTGSIRPLTASAQTGVTGLLAQTGVPVLGIKEHLWDVSNPHLLAVPIHHDIDRQLLGYLVLPKRGVPLPSERYGTRFKSLNIHCLTSIGTTLNDPMPCSYWEKFGLQTIYEYLDRLDTAYECPSRVSGFKLVLQMALVSPSLCFPDSSPERLENIAWKYRTSAAREYRVSDWEGPANRGVGTDTARFLGWMSGMWRQQRIEEIKHLTGQRTALSGSDLPYHGWPEQLGQHLSPPDLPADATMDDDSEQLIEVEYQFALCLRKMEKQAAENTASAPRAQQKRIKYPKLLGSVGKYYDLEYLPRDLFYGSEYFQFVLQMDQEQIMQQICQIAASSNQPARLRAHAALQFGIGLLTGFGLDQDIDRGLEWIRKAADGGSRKAHAIVGRLHRAYGRKPAARPGHVAQLVREAKHGSAWALEELKNENEELHKHTVKDATSRAEAAMYKRQRDMEDELASRFRAIRTPRDYRRDIGLRKLPAPSQPGQSSAQDTVREVEPGVEDRGSQHNSPEGTERDFSDGEGDRSLYTPRYWDREAEKPSKRDQVRQFLARLYDLAVRCMCCGSGRALYQRAEFVIGIRIGEQISFALAAGQGEAALALLAGDAKIDKDSAPYLLYQLHHLRPEHAEPVARAIVEMGFDVNEKVDIRHDKFSNRHWRSMFGDAIPRSDRGVWDAAGPEPRDYFRHWSSELRGQSLTPLRWAIFNNNEHVVKALLSLGAEFPRVPDAAACAAHPGPWVELPPEAFTAAVLDEPCLNKEILNMFFERHGSQRGRAVFAETPLGLIAMQPDTPEWRLRLWGRRGAREQFEDVLALLRENQPGSDAQLFWAAAMNGHIDIIQHLLKSGVSVETRHNGLTPLHTAVLHGQKGVFEFLLQNDAEVHALTSEKGMSMAHLLFWKPMPRSTELFMLNKLHRLGVDMKGGSGEFGKMVRPIHLAALNFWVEAVQRLMELGADPECPVGEDLMTSFDSCHQNQAWKAEVLDDILLAQDSNAIKPCSIEGLTPAGIVLTRSDMAPPTKVQALLQALLFPPSTNKATSPPTPHISRLYTRPDKHQTIFHLLASKPRLISAGILDSLLYHCTNPALPTTTDPLNLPDADGDTPLHYAALFAGNGTCTAAVDKLLALRADPSIKNVFGVTPGMIGACALVSREMLPAARGLVSDAADGVKPRERTVQVWLPPAEGEGEEGSLRSLALRSGEGVEGAVHWRVRLRDAGELFEGEPTVVAVIAQLLRGTVVKEVLDLETGGKVALGGEATIQMSTELDAAAESYRGVE